jgi:uncharacterized protein YjbI with pentapeptide repeats
MMFDYRALIRALRGTVAESVQMRWEAKVVGHMDVEKLKDKIIHLDHVHLRGEDFSGRKLMAFGTVGCRLENCRFNNIQIEAAAQFGAGKEMSKFIECSFDGAQIWGLGGLARFERCSFRNAKLRDWTCGATEFIDCVFSGTLHTTIFYGTIDDMYRPHVNRERNEFRGNDFSAMKLIDVAFRGGIDLSLQRLPKGPVYVYLSDAAAALANARAALEEEWHDPEVHRQAEPIFKSLELEIQWGQRQLLIRPADFYGKSDRQAVDEACSLLKTG